MTKRICFFGLYDSAYSRHQVLAAGFKQNGWEVVECQVNPRQYQTWLKYWYLFQAWRKMPNRPEIVLVAHPGQTVVWLARILWWRQRLVFDAFTSLYDSNVFDRQLYPAGSWRGRRDFWLDWHSLRLADIIIADTEEDIKYLTTTFNLPARKIRRVFVGSMINSRLETPSSGRYFLVHWHGTYIPLQGIDYIARAAKLLESEPKVRFRLIGAGQTSGDIAKLVAELQPTNIEFLPRVSFAELADKMMEADIVLGIFGLTAKAARVIPNKVFEGLALGKPVITADTPAARELLTDGQNVLFCQAGNPSDLSAKIMTLKNDLDLRRTLAMGAQKLFADELSPRRLLTELANELANQ